MFRRNKPKTATTALSAAGEARPCLIRGVLLLVTGSLFLFALADSRTPLWDGVEALGVLVSYFLGTGELRRAREIERG